MSHKKHNVCINAKKVFDWVIRPVNVSETYSGKQFFKLTDCPMDLCDTDGCFGTDFTADVKVFDVQAKELPQSGGREKMKVTINGETVTLHKVRILVTFKVKVKILDGDSKVCSTEDPIDFCTIETFYLCAPKGTCVDATVLDGMADAEFFCCNNTPTLTLSADFCLDVQVTDFVKLEVEASYCNPRDEFPISDVMVCEPLKEPKQCPHVFPGKKPKC
ncbi:MULTISPECIES: BMQ_0737 family morphogenetic spore coat protein [Alkalihalophilus]|uniref:SipL SPOCS domain-containing protein n=1 Tax=Alkalihalophilus pseudofirmus (strain ATCC BAA-2126 / JCM 17055 / OF4) TaxID=398511 RepID=D3FUZ9_ALKPO|nr:MULTISPECIES: hypothetical protein [Alkalihalophilus]ADC48425.1 hypothetical protein BpOF4_01790 [Alkalihalophilus pseudofirmus OF4]MEC2073785.1 hypothetical protein [Alkalihalophilus marmarensis]MED1601078.1 hypothetical protein [Alkalihalophilus marmarensis]OLS39460.1 hypothetical protein BTR22_00900 [Alkalihalophilus pseudofirmus]